MKPSPLSSLPRPWRRAIQHLDRALAQNDPDTGDIKPPEITSNKTNVQLIAEMEEYAARITARKTIFHQAKLAAQQPSSTPPQAPTENPEGVKSISPGLERGDYPGLEPQMDQGSMPEASRVPMQSGRAHLKLPSNSQPPLSDYDKALLEGKSQQEAIYAQFTPTPEELARRQRENESLRRASASSRQTWTAPALQPGFAPPGSIPSSKLYGPCPSPYGWQGSRFRDPWKVQTS
jgi:hypothetical protein